MMSDSSDYLSCLDESISELEQSFELPLDGSELEEPVPPLDDENWPSVVEIYSVPLSHSPLFLCLTNRSTQIDEHAPDQPRDGVTLVIWDLNCCGSFQLASYTSILPKWWHSLTCYSYFVDAAYMKLSPSDAAGGGFTAGHDQSDDMEGQLKWDPQALETPWQ